MNSGIQYQEIQKGKEIEEKYCYPICSVGQEGSDKTHKVIQTQGKCK